VADYLKTQAAVPVWLVGTSMGTFSAAGRAIAARNVDGLVLTSTITRAEPDWEIAQSHRNGVASHAVGENQGSNADRCHAKDGCASYASGRCLQAPPGPGESRTVDVVLLDGGSPPQSEPCEAAIAARLPWASESETVDTIVRFIKANRNVTAPPATFLNRDHPLP